MLIPNYSTAAQLDILNPRYCKVLGKNEEFISYLWREDVIPLWVALPLDKCEATMSVAAVEKRDSTDLRKILMVVPFNAACRPLTELFEEVEARGEWPHQRNPRGAFFRAIACLYQ